MGKKLFENIPTYDWEQLEGKSLTIRVSSDISDDGCYKGLYGIDPINNVIYCLAETWIKDDV